MMKHLLLSASLLLTATAANAAGPVGADEFNVDAPFDLASVSPENFDEIVVPAAKAEGELTFFDFTNSFGPLFQEHLLPRFEEEFGITVNYIRGNGDTAVQQLIAAINAGHAAPADVYFMGSGSSLTALMEAGVIGNLPLHLMLPATQGMNPDLLTVAAGKAHGGTYVPYHRNQTSMVYNSALVGADEVPSTMEELLAYAEANPGTVAVTNPTRGGSGDGFLQSVALALVTDETCRASFADYALSTEEAEALVAADCFAPVWDYYSALLPVVELTNGNSDTLTLVANGVARIGTAWEDMAYDFMTRGLLPGTIRQTILETGQIGGGDGMFVPVGVSHPAAALVFVDYMSSLDMQLVKLSVNGSRSARTDIDPALTFTPEQLNRLAPIDEFNTRAAGQLPEPIKQAMKDYFLSNILS